MAVRGAPSSQESEPPALAALCGLEQVARPLGTSEFSCVVLRGLPAVAAAITFAPTDPCSGWGTCGAQVGRLGGTKSPVDTGSLGPVPRQPVCTLMCPESCLHHPTFGPPATTTGDSAEAPLKPCCSGRVPGHCWELVAGTSRPCRAEIVSHMALNGGLSGREILFLRLQPVSSKIG